MGARHPAPGVVVLGQGHVRAAWQLICPVKLHFECNLKHLYKLQSGASCPERCGIGGAGLARITSKHCSARFNRKQLSQQRCDDPQAVRAGTNAVAASHDIADMGTAEGSQGRTFAYTYVRGRYTLRALLLPGDVGTTWRNVR